MSRASVEELESTSEVSQSVSQSVSRERASSGKRTAPAALRSALSSSAWFLAARCDDFRKPFASETERVRWAKASVKPVSAALSCRRRRRRRRRRQQQSRGVGGWTSYVRSELVSRE